MLRFWVVIYVTIVILDAVGAFCMISLPIQEKTLTGHKQMCLYTKGEMKMKFEIDSYFTTDCQHCRCGKHGLLCCGIGFYGGVMMAPHGCRYVADGCKALLIQDDGDKNLTNWKHCAPPTQPPLFTIQPPN